MTVVPLFLGTVVSGQLSVEISSTGQRRYLQRAAHRIRLTGPAATALLSARLFGGL